MLKRTLFCCCLVLAGCGRGKTPEIRIAVGGQAQLIYLPALLAQELGFYKEAGLNVSLIEFQGGAKALESMMGGSAEVVCGFYDHTIQMRAEGKELRAFVAILRYPGVVLVSPNVADIERLRGKTVGVTSLGSSSHMLVNFLLVKHGMKPDDVSDVAIGGGSTAVGAVTHHKVDAAIVSDPALTMVRKEMPGLNILADMRTAEGIRSLFGAEAYVSTVFYSKADWIEQNRETAKLLAGVMIRTLSWMRSHTAEEIREKAPPAFRTGDARGDLEILETLLPMLSVDGKFTPEAVEAVRRVLSTSLPAVRDAKIDLTKTYTNEMIP